ncbi:MAG: hypothetical protein DDT19_02646 [Syntrophomonadaceae bacterium]|nr:hypothetical protein [Bacillota bacterium]
MITHRKRILVFSIIAALVFLFWSFPALNEGLTKLFISSQTFIELHPILGIFVFLALAALSAIFVFFSSIVIVPVAVFVWGEVLTFFLLLLGWFIGGLIAYGLGKHFGRKIAEYFISAGKIDSCGDLFSKKLGIFDVVLLKLALPSEIPSFFLGIVRYPFLKYLLVLVLSELPFALWAVYLSGAFVAQDRVFFIVALIVGFAFLSVVARILRARSG